MKHLIYFFGFIVISTCFVSTLHANDGHKEKWYQVEVIFFAYQKDPNSSGELWRDSFEPVYPENMVLLRPHRPMTDEDLPEIKINRQRIFGSSLANVIISSQEETSIEEPPEAEFPESPESNLSEEITSDDPFNLLEGINLSPLGQPDQIEEARPIWTDLKRDPYLLLPYDEFELKRTATRLSSAYDTRLLGHFAWRQPAYEEEEAPSILVQFGNQYDLFFELEGTIQFSENRYPHVITDLYYSGFSEKILTDPLNWDRFSAERGINQGVGYTSGADSFDYATENSQNYRREFTAALHHDRRLKKDEIHYFDHPLFGMLVLLREYKLPDPAMTMEEFDLSQLPKRKPLPEVKVPE